MHHNYWACALDPMSHSYWACAPQLLSPCAATTEAHAPRAHDPQKEKPLQREAHALQQRVAPALHNWRKLVQKWIPNAAKNKLN